MIRRIIPLFAVGILAACGSSSGDTPVASGTTTAGAQAVATDAPDAASDTTNGDTTADVVDDVASTDSGAAVIAAPAALQFSAPLVGGDDIELTTLAGRPVLLWFWAPW